MESSPPKYKDSGTPVHTVSVSFAPEKWSATYDFDEATTFGTMLEDFQLMWPQYDWTKSKAIIGGRRPPGIKSLIKSPDDQDMDLSPLKSNPSCSIKLMAPKISDLASLKQSSAAAAAIQAKRAAQRAAARARTSRIINNNSSRSPHQGAQKDLQHTFHTLRPLPYLPNPARSLTFLERLRDDPGIRAAMRKHAFSVGLLTEMDPGQYTEANHEGTTRILGLNRNRGEVIELRLRTDAYDGYRDYKTIRKTLCHELAHNVHSDHDRAFWDLTRQIEKEVAAADWKSGGRSVGGEEYAPVREGEDEGEDGEMFMDHGGWEGGTYVLGGTGGSGANGEEGEGGLTRREILARAAEQRLRNLSSGGAGSAGKAKEKEETRGGSGSGSGDGSTA